MITGLSGDKQFTANYDPDLQISSINHALPQAFDENYTYDDNGNRLTSLTNSFIYDDLNKLTESTTHTYAYDADGNMTQERNKITGETKKFYWDSENRMIKFEHQVSDISPVDISATYKYDIFGRRIQKNVNGNVINFFWENDTMTYELNESHQPIRKYLVGLGIDSYEGHLEYSEVTDWPHLFDPNYSQPWYSYMKDQVGTIYKLYSLKVRSVVDNRTYDSFGNLVNQTGTTMTPLGFQGKYYDQESELNYFYHRYYNPGIGRFTSEDPIGVNGGLNMYEVMGNDAMNSIDPFGMDRINDLGNEFHKWFGGYYELNQKIMDKTGKIEEIIGGTIKNIVDFNWCRFINCVTENKELLNGIALSMGYNITLALSATFFPPEYFILAEWNGYLWNIPVFIEMFDTISYCISVAK